MKINNLLIPDIEYKKSKGKEKKKKQNSNIIAQWKI